MLLGLIPVRMPLFPCHVFPSISQRFKERPCLTMLLAVQVKCSVNVIAMPLGMLHYPCVTHQPVDIPTTPRSSLSVDTQATGADAHQRRTLSSASALCHPISQRAYVRSRYAWKLRLRIHRCLSHSTLIAFTKAIMKFLPATTLRAAKSSRHYLANVTYSSSIGIVFTKMTVNSGLGAASCHMRT